MFGLGALALLTWQGQKAKFKLDRTLWDRLASFWQYPLWWVITLHFVVVLLSGYYSDDTQFWLARLRIKAPFLLLPMAFYLLPTITRHTYRTMHASLVIVMVISTVPILGTILGDPQAILERLADGKSIETPGNHIRYSLLIALGAVSAFILWVQKFSIHRKWEPTLWLVLGVYLFLFAHLLAVRSGLLALYAALFLLACIGLTKRIKWRWSLLAIGILIASPLASYLAIPSLKTKMEYTIRDFENNLDGKWSGFSDAQRIRSVEGGLHLGLKHPWVGVGAGDLRSEMQSYFLTHLNKTSFLLPHNQFVTLFASCGLIGLILFQFALFLPLIRFLQEPLLLSMQVIIILSLLVENTFEVSSGVAIYIFYLGAGLNYCKKDLTQFKLKGSTAE